MSVFRIFGARRVTMDASHGPGVEREELSILGRLTRLLTRDPVKLEPPGKRRGMISTDDLVNGVLPKDWRERKAERRKRQEESQSAGREFAIYDRDCDPD